MESIAFRQMPLSVRLMTCASMFMAWVLIAEFVIDRYGLDAFLPFYRVGNVCPYELVVAALIVAFWVIAHRRR